MNTFAKIFSLKFNRFEVTIKTVIFKMFDFVNEGQI